MCQPQRKDPATFERSRRSVALSVGPGRRGAASHQAGEFHQSRRSVTMQDGTRDDIIGSGNLGRRAFLKTAGVATVAAGGIEGILAAGRAPAHAQGTKLHLLRWNDFVPAADEALAKLMTDANKALGAQ